MMIRASFSLVKPESSAEYARPEAAFDAANLEAGTDYARPEAALDAAKLEAGTDYEKFVTSVESKYVSDNRFVFDRAAPLDITIINTTKIFADHSIVASIISSKATSKGLSDSAGLVDKVTTVFLIRRRFDDTASVSSDIRNIDSSKALSDSSYGVTSSPIFSIGKLLQDHAYATDDFFGETNVDDDQSMLFTKVSTSSAASTDNFDRTVSFNRAFDDVVEDQVIDSFDISSTKVFVENYFATDSIKLVDVGKSLTDDASTQTQTAISLSTTKQDTLSASEVFTREVSFSRAFTDNGSAVDDAELLVNKLVEDSCNAQDTFTRSVTSSRFFTDQVFLTDDINGLASIDDDQTMLFNKFVTSTIITNSDPRLSLTKNITDSGAVSDSGELYAQGYMKNMDYFVLGYVGTTGSF